MDLLGLDPSKLGHAQLAMLRERYKTENPSLYEWLAPFEHQAFAREWTREMPWLAAPSLAVATPAYAVAKGLGFMTNQGEATPPSWEQVFRGYKGIWQGLTQ